MSYEKVLEENWEDISRKMNTIQEALTWSDSGRKVTEASVGFAQSPAMQSVMAVLSDEKIDEMERFKMSQYFAQALEGEPDKNMAGFEKYLDDLSKNEKYPNHQWYGKIKQAVAGLRADATFQNYVKVYNAFQADSDPKAVESRAVIKTVSESLREIMKKVEG